jgi:hypothetical protein
MGFSGILPTLTEPLVVRPTLSTVGWASHLEGPAAALPQPRDEGRIYPRLTGTQASRAILWIV